MLLTMVSVTTLPLAASETTASQVENKEVGSESTATAASLTELSTQSISTRGVNDEFDPYEPITSLSYCTTIARAYSFSSIECKNINGEWIAKYNNIVVLRVKYVANSSTKTTYYYSDGKINSEYNYTYKAKSKKYILATAHRYDDVNYPGTSTPWLLQYFKFTPCSDDTKACYSYAEQYYENYSVSKKVLDMKVNYFSGQTIEDVELDDAKRSSQYEYTKSNVLDKSFFWYSNGQYKTKYEYASNGKTVAYRYNFHTNGKTKQYTSYYSNGKARTASYYDSKGKATRYRTWYTNGKTKYIDNYKNGKATSSYNYNSKGKRTYIVQYYANGRTKTRVGYYSNGRRKSYVTYYSNGRTKAIVNYYSNGKLKVSITYYSSGKTKSYRSYNSKGKLTYSR